ncbi:MAG: PAS domain-containing protein [Anaerolineae bacterium]|nr:PAS domain-containing protein [Anaerolineae bacterium]
MVNRTLWSRAVKFAAPPSIAGLDEQAARAARALHYVLVGIMVMIIPAVLLILLFGDLKVISLLFAAAGTLVCLFSLWRLRRGYIRQTSLILISFYWTIDAVLLAVTGGMLTAAASLFVGVIIMAALFVNWRASVMVTVLTVLYSLAIVFLKDSLHALPQIYVFDDFRSWMVFVLAALLVVIPVITMQNSMADALKLARQQLAEREKAERSLRDSEERYRLVSTMIWDYAFAFDISPEGRLIPAWITAESFGRLTGYSADEVWKDLGATYLLYHADDLERARQDVARTIQGEETTAEYRIVRGDGQIRWVRLQRKPIWDAVQGRVIRFVGAAQDITDEKEAGRMRLEFALQKERQQTYRDVISGLSHDIKTPLTVINTSLYALERSSSPEEGRQHIENVRRQTRRVRDFIEDLLAVSRMDSAPQLRLHDIELDELLSSIHDELRPIIDSKRQTFALHFSPALPIVRADEALLRRAFVNVIQNAVHYTPEGGAIRIYAQRVGELVCIDISDTGVGIPEADLDHIFEPFFRGAEARVRRKSGSGIGLAVVQQVITHHGGRIEVESKLHVGSTFRIWLPASRSGNLGRSPDVATSGAGAFR